MTVKADLEAPEKLNSPNFGPSERGVWLWARAERGVECLHPDSTYDQHRPPSHSLIPSDISINDGDRRSAERLRMQKSATLSEQS
ncbi:hypothetical protein PHBOTO_001104 [Pseudozyma hubeiensis]|nr:hypothetical protein PHBOTO_001104 [Pseudozyma hubeiensis]